MEGGGGGEGEGEGGRCEDEGKTKNCEMKISMC